MTWDATFWCVASCGGAAARSLLVSDLDGTLLRPDAPPTHSTS